MGFMYSGGSSVRRRSCKRHSSSANNTRRLTACKEAGRSDTICTVGPLLLTQGLHAAHGALLSLCRPTSGTCQLSPCAVAALLTSVMQQPQCCSGNAYCPSNAACRRHHRAVLQLLAAAASSSPVRRHCEQYNICRIQQPACLLASVFACLLHGPLLSPAAPVRPAEWHRAAAAAAAQGPRPWAVSLPLAGAAGALHIAPRRGPHHQQ